MSSSKNNAAADSSSFIDTRRIARKKSCFCCPQAVEQTPKKTGSKVTKKTDNSVDREERSKNSIQTNRMPRELVNLGTNILDTSIVLRNDNYAAHDNKKKNKYSRLLDPKIITSYQYSKDQYFKIEILKGNRKQIEGFEEVTNVEENNKRYMINLTVAQSQVLHNGGCLLIKKGIFPVDVKLTKINNPANQAVSKKNNGEIIINSVINVKKYSDPSCNSGTKLKINLSTERMANSTVLPEPTNQIVKNVQNPRLVRNRKKNYKYSKTEENALATVEPKRSKRLEARKELLMSNKKDNQVRKLVINQGDSTIQKEQVCTNVNGLMPIKVPKLKNSSPTTVVNNEQITQSTEFNGSLNANVKNNVQFERLVGRSNPIENEILQTPIKSILKVGRSNPIKNEILPTSNKSILQVFDLSLIEKMRNENIEENEKITEDINTEDDSVLLIEDDPIDSITPRRWLQEIKTITKKTTIIKTREILAEQIK